MRRRGKRNRRDGCPRKKERLLHPPTGLLLFLGLEWIFLSRFMSLSPFCMAEPEKRAARDATCSPPTFLLHLMTPFSPGKLFKLPVTGEEEEKAEGQEA